VDSDARVYACNRYVRYILSEADVILEKDLDTMETKIVYISETLSSCKESPIHNLVLEADSII